jgi:eukaryotic-like serine/threonine-protein kinase
VGDDARHEAVKAAFAQALDRAADERTAFLESLRRREPEIAAEVEELLGHHDPNDSFLESSIVERLADETPRAETLVGRRIGRYRLTRLIAAGSMGAVYEAEQEEPKRAVAVKVLRAGSMSPRTLRRFRYEAEVLGRLRHPGVAEIYEAGTQADGALLTPYFAMELVPEARPITEHARERSLSLAESLELFMQVCRAVHHGHQKGVIHRDLKPANILVGSSGQAKVIDFGVARAVDADPAATGGTLGGQLVGTLQYMSPEQLRPGADDLDVRTDVYALGVVLFELVTGEAPHDLDGLSFVEAADLLRRRPMPMAGARRREARGDLEAIISQAADADRRRRYQSAEALAEDVGRYLRSEPVRASRPSLWRQFQLFARRRAGTVAAAAAIAAALVGATVVSVWFSFEADRARAAETIARVEAQRSAERAERVVSLLRDMISLGESGADASVAVMLEEAVSRLDAGLEEDPLVEASLREAIGQTLHGLGRLQAAETQLRAALGLHEQTLGPAAPESLRGASALAMTLAERGKLGEAIALAERSAAALEPASSPRLVGESLVARAEVARRIGRPADADELFGRALRVLDRQSPMWVQAGLARAETRLEAERWSAASETVRDLLRFMDDQSLSDRRRAARILAIASRGLGRLEIAEQQLANLSIRNRADLGPAHPETLRTVAAWHETRAIIGPQGAASAAADAIGTLTESAAATLEPGRPVLAELRTASARALELAGRDAEAENVLRRRATSLAMADTADRPSVVSAVLDLAELMSRRGAHAPAAALASEIRRTNRSMFPEGCVPRARAVVLLAEAGGPAGRTPAPYDELAEARRTLETQLGPDHALTRRAAALLASG